MSITGRSFHNQALQGAESALSGMLIRNAAYTGKPLTWEEFNSRPRYIKILDHICGWFRSQL